MNPELERQLIAKYPKLFGDVSKSPTQSLMCFGCECGNGWYNIIDNLCGFITNLQKNSSYGLGLKDESEVRNNKGFDGWLHCPDVVFMQIKEKYGTLRVYWHFAELENYEKIKASLMEPEQLEEHISKYHNQIENIIDFCEYLSSKTCEVTGKAGKLYSKGWCVTLCKEEAIKRFGFDPDEEENTDTEEQSA